MRFSLNRFLSAVSFALDFVEIDFLGATSNHSRRVAYISYRLSKYFGMKKDEQFDLFSFALLHDNGLSEDVLLTGIKTELPADRHKQLEQYTVHCDIGEKNVVNFPFRTGQKNVILYHHENFDGSGFLGIPGTDIPIMAQIIALADTVDNLYHFETRNQRNREDIISFVTKNRGHYYSPDLVDAFLEISSHTHFWIDLQEPFIYDILKKINQEEEIDLQLEDILQITRIFSKIIDSKSKFTSRHTSMLMEKAGIVTDFYQFSHERKMKFLIAASLHDLGKLAIPNSILDKPGSLTGEELGIVKSHPYYTRAALSKIDGFEQITEWAANHHETLDGIGYPYGIDKTKMGFEEKLMACIDIYQALTEDRPYRKGMNHQKAIKILMNNASYGKIDRMIADDIDSVFQTEN